MASLAKRASDGLRNTWFEQTRVGKFIVNVLVELDHVTWPTKDEVVNSAVVVIVTTLIFGAFIGGVDVVLAQFFKWLAGLGMAS
ncbi:preprotein translocase subunit SecE [bacterium]|nr:preprotein translocase subunit SecE [bacterium]